MREAPTSALPELSRESDERLLTLSAGHPFRRFAFQRAPSHTGTSTDAVRSARSFVLAVMVADLGSAHSNSPYLKNDCHALIRCALWTASWDPDLLQPTLFFDEAHLQRYGLVGTGRNSHRSRIALLASLRQFRGAYPKLFPPSQAAPAEPPGLRPISDKEFEHALERAETFRSESTCRYVHSWLLLGRAAGLDGADMRFVAGTDVVVRRQQGLWVVVRHPGHERDVPVLLGWADQLRELAQLAGSNSMISRSAPPASINRSSELSSMLARHLDRDYADLKVTANRLRAAWLTEQLRRDVPLRSLLQAAGLGTLRSIEWLVAELPEPARSTHELAIQLGGVEEASRKRLSLVQGGKA